MIELFFDVETQKLFSDITSSDPADLEISVVSVYRRQVDDAGGELGGTMASFWHPSASLTPTIEEMWEWFEHADRIVGFNSKKFDVPALRPHYPKDLTKLPHFDIMEHVRDAIGRRISLDALARDTLDKHKTDVGTNAVYYWANRNAENLDTLRQYCESDVLITKDLYDFGMTHKYLTYRDLKRNAPVSIPVDFSYPKGTPAAQIGLF